jgi:hypothetical protein
MEYIFLFRDLQPLVIQAQTCVRKNIEFSCKTFPNNKNRKYFHEANGWNGSLNENRGDVT